MCMYTPVIFFFGYIKARESELPSRDPFLKRRKKIIRATRRESVCLRYRALSCMYNSCMRARGISPQSSFTCARPSRHPRTGGMKIRSGGLLRNGGRSDRHCRHGSRSHNRIVENLIKIFFLHLLLAHTAARLEWVFAFELTAETLAVFF
jgi:hypothetical protein